MSKAPEYVFTILYGLSGVFGAAAGFVEGNARVVLIALFVSAFVLGVLFHLAFHSTQTAKRLHDQRQVDAATAKERFLYTNVIGHDLRYLIHVVAEAASTEDRPQRQALAAIARQSIICATSKMVGRDATEGTRANLFRLSGAPGSRVMTLEPNGFYGRGDVSHRIYREDAGDVTFDRTMENKVRFVPSVQDEYGSSLGLPYETFLTHPVSIGSERILGVLTVDCLKTGQLDEDLDVPVMAVLSTLIAITYECEKYQSPRRVR